MRGLKEGEEVLRYSVLTVVSSKGRQEENNWADAGVFTIQSIKAGTRHKTVKWILLEVGNNCQGSLTVLRAVSQYSWGVSVQTLNYWPELLRATISPLSREEGGEGE